jgi:L-malate glycosyltransferase
MKAMRPRVVVLSDYQLRPDRVGGMDRFFWALDERVRGLEWALTWVFPESDDVSHYAARGIELALLPRRSFYQAVDSYLADLRPVDLMVSHFVAYASRLPWRWKRSGVLRYLAVDHMSRPARNRGLTERVRRRLKGVFIQPAVDQVIAVSDFVADAIRRELGGFWGSKICVVPNGIDCGVFFPAELTPNEGEADRPLHLVTVAHLIPEKGIQILLEALRLTHHRLPHFRLLIAGSGPWEQELRSQTGSNRLDECVHFLGSTASQAELLRSADIAVMPSLWQEACPFTALEAMATAVPVIASFVGGLSTLVGVGPGWLVPPGDPEALADAIVRLAGDPTARGQMGQAGLRRVREHYTLETMVSGHLSVMERCLGRHR